MNASPALRILEWRTLDDGARARALSRPAATDRDLRAAQVRNIVNDVRARGDTALREWTLRLDRAAVDTLRVPAADLASALAHLPDTARAALQRAIDNVRAFHAAQQLEPLQVETVPGVRCERIVRPIEAIGLYIPAGSAPLPSAVVMLAVPAALAGCPRRVLCSPPDAAGRVHATILAAAALCGVDEVYRIGGAQAVAAMAYGTDSVPKVDKIFGPGSSWVTAAKQYVAADPDGAALDLPAGPSEVLVIADAHADAAFVAADLLAQAEHDVTAQAILVTPSRPLAEAVAREVDRQRATLSRADILQRSLAQSRAIVVGSLEEAIEVSNRYAPEHLILQVAAPREALARVRSAGSVFLGAWTPESMGDYCSGTNHVLPTYGYARAYSGLSLHDFVKRITVQELSQSGLQNLGPTAVRLAQLEGLDAHGAAVECRLASLGRSSAA
jgi:histidinol dehydrogenase